MTPLAVKRYANNCHWTVTSNTTSTTSANATAYYGSLLRDDHATGMMEWVEAVRRVSGKARVEIGDRATINLPDGSVLHVDAQGNYRIDDAHAQVVYRTNRVREFNRFLNASDLLEEFIGWIGSLGLGQRQLLNLPVELFIRWVILKAAETDGDPLPPEEQRPEHHPALLPPKRIFPKCRCCGRFIRKAHHLAGLDFCGQTHLLAFAEKAGVR